MNQQIRPVQLVFNLPNRTLRDRIRASLFALQPSEEKSEQYCDYVYVYRSGAENLAVKQYSSGKLQLQGRAGELVRDVLEVIFSQHNLAYPRAPRRVEDYLGTSPGQALRTSPPTASTGPPPAEIPFPHIGTDESGKGDYFGPLVVGAVWVDQRTEALLKTLGVRDSKTLTDSACLKLASEIRQVCGGGVEIVEILPQTYNDLYDRFRKEGKTLNHLLAWGHARALESVLERCPAQDAVADQFGNKKYIESTLMEKGKRLKLVQTPRAERYTAVAAASIVARAQFLTRLRQLQERIGIALPKGASRAVVDAGRSVVANRGPDALRSVAKLHFKTTQAVLNQSLGEG